MEQEPGQDPERDGPAGSQPPPDSSQPGDAGSAGPDASGASGGDADAGPDAGSGDDDDGESVFGPWEGLEGTVGAAREREELLAGFAPGGVWDKHPPGPELAVAVARAAGPEWRCGLATGEEKIGLLRAMAAVQSWSGAGLLGMIRALIRDDDPPFLGRPRHGDLPDEWDESLVHEIALALAVSAPSAGRTAQAAWELGARLPGVGLLLRDGTLDVPRARLVTEVFGELSDESCARAEELLLPELTAPPRKTYTQVERIATAIAAAVDPGLAERRRKAAEKHGSRVAMFREPSGAAGLSGRDLPVGETLAAYASLDARARLYKDSGAFAGERADRLRATAYLDILNGVSADDRIACGHLSSDPDPDPAPDRDTDPDPAPNPNPGDAPDDDGPAGAGPDGGGPGDSPGSGGSDCPCDECDGRCTPPDDSDHPDGEPGDDEPDDSEPSDSGPGGNEPGGDEDPDHGGPGEDGGPGGGQPPGGDHPDAGQSASGPPPTLTDLVLPLATLLGQAERPGEGHGLGTLDPALCRALAATATLSPHTTLCLTVTDPDGIAIGHGCAKTGRPGRLARPPDGPAPPLVALSARINLTITAARLAAMLASPDPPRSPAAGGWAISPSDAPRAGRTRAASGTGTVAHAPGTTVARRPQRPPGDPDWCRDWTLTLPSGPQITVQLEPVPTYECDHRNESHAYKPNATLRHLVQIRDYACTFPPCSRHARESDFEHAVPYDQGGRTCGCNAGARSRKCHRIKQSPGWNVTQPQPGWHQWTTPRGRTYTQGPKHYPV
jgi:Domain of unknown function (DUF222)